MTTGTGPSVACSTTHRPFHETGATWRVSNRGGQTPAWRGDGREIYYLAPDGMLMVAGTLTQWRDPAKLQQSEAGMTLVELLVAFPVYRAYVVPGERFPRRAVIGDAKVNVAVEAGRKASRGDHHIGFEDERLGQGRTNVNGFLVEHPDVTAKLLEGIQAAVPETVVPADGHRALQHHEHSGGALARYEQARAAGRKDPRIALAAPTGKAAARLTESVRKVDGTLKATTVGDEQ